MRQFILNNGLLSLGRFLKAASQSVAIFFSKNRKKMKSPSVFFVACLCLLWLSVSTVPEKHVGLPYRFQAINDNKPDVPPGITFHMPFIDTMSVMQHTSQVDEMKAVSAFTKNGIPIVYDVIQIVNRFRDPSYVRDIVRRFGQNYDQALIFDTIFHTMAELTSGYTAEECQITKFKDFNEILANRLNETLVERNVTGLLVEAVRVKQPRIPTEIQNNYVEREKERTAIAVANQTRLVRLTEAGTAKEEAKVNAQREKEVALIQAEQRRAVQQVELRILEDIAASEIGRLVNMSNANASMTLKQAEATASANRLIFSPEYLRLQEIHSWKQATKTIVYSDSEPLSFPLSPLLSQNNV